MPALISRFAAHRRNATTPQRALVVLALLAYASAGAIVPQGHMAAPVSSGTPFHLCPGDLRSAQIIDALPKAAGEHHHHHHHGHHDDGGIDKTAADPGCTFAGFGSAIAYLQRVAVDPQWQGQGMGRSLVRVVTRKARESGAKVLLLNTQLDNHSAIGLYEDEGFVKLPEPLSLLHFPS